MHEIRTITNDTCPIGEWHSHPGEPDHYVGAPPDAGPVAVLTTCGHGQGSFEDGCPEPWPCSTHGHWWSTPFARSLPWWYG